MKHRDHVIRGLGVIRLTVGLATFVRPQLARRTLGLGAGRDDDGGTVARMFGIRDALLAAAALSPEPSVRDTGLRLGILADAADALAVLLGTRSGVTARAAALVGGSAVLATVAGLAALPRPPQDRLRTPGLRT